MRVAIVFIFLILSALVYAECNTAPTDANESITSLGPFVVDVLVNANDNESQMLTVEINSTTCPGTASVEFEMIRLDPEPRLYNDCQLHYQVIDDLGASTTSTVYITMPTHIFSDGFETGSTSEWTTTQQKGVLP